MPAEPGPADRQAPSSFIVGLLLIAGMLAINTRAEALPGGFTESTAFSGLQSPTTVRFSPDGRVFVAEKSGLIKVFDSLSDTTPTIFADLRTKVHNFWDRGLLGLALHPNFPTIPYAYVLYAHDAAIGGSAPLWGTVGGTSDGCPNPPGATTDGCVVSGRLSRLTADGNVMTGPEEVLIEDWGQQYPSHSIGALAFGTDGALYVSGGDGASFGFVDYGQDGSPPNPLGDPPGSVGTPLSPPSAEGGALRSQSPRRPAGEPVVLDGAILRVDPSTGAALPNNPLFGHADPNARRIVAYGLRNPFRFTLRPGTNEVWIADVGWSTWEEINRVSNPLASVVTNFGWPCYEGVGRQISYDEANLTQCEQLYATSGAVTAPFYTYNHSAKVVVGETCSTGSSSTTGLAFYGGGSYPAAYSGALFFADYSRQCVWVMFPGAGGLPDPATRSTFIAPAAGPVDLQIGPGGDLFYVDINSGTIRRIAYTSGNQVPVAVIQASPLNGPAPLTVSFDASGSSDPDPGTTLTYSWDLNGDGVFGDATTISPTFTYTTVASYTARLRVTDNLGASSTVSILINAGNTTPTAVIDGPTVNTTWRVGDLIVFSGHATDPQQGSLPASALFWSIILHHCPSNCHTHPLQTFTGVASGSFPAPDHEYPSHLELQLTATDAGGLQHTSSRLIYPATVSLTFQSAPSGLQLVVGSSSSATPFSRTVIVGSTNSVTASSPQTLASVTYQFTSWSDGGAQSHNLVAGQSPSTYTAAYGTADPTTTGLVAAYSFNQGSGTSAPDASVNGHHGTISGATWTTATAGKFGSALSFDGVNDWVTVADSTLLDFTTGMTLAAWVYPTAHGTGIWRNVVMKEKPGDEIYSLYSSSGAGRAAAGVVFTTGSFSSVTGTQSGALNAWTHLTTTFDGSVLRLYVDGVQVATRTSSGAILASSGPLRIGGNAIWAEFFQGRIDEVRLYSRALSASEIQTVMTTPVPSSGNTPPTAIATAAPLSGPAPLTVTFNGTGSSDPDAGDSVVAYAWDLDGDGVYGDSTVAQPTFTYTVAGTYNVTLRVTDSHGASATSTPFAITASGPPSGPVAAYSLNQGTGLTAADGSGNGHTGTISGATWTTAGKYGRALSFDGVNDWVTVADSNLLDLSPGMTIAAWVYPTAHGTGVWRNVLMKEKPGDEIYSLYSSNGTGRPTGGTVLSSGSLAAVTGPQALPLNAWTHLAITYDGSMLRLHVNGVEVATRSSPGSIPASSGPFRIGGNGIWGEFFQGRIDDVRIYNRALSLNELQSVMNTPLP